MAVNKPEIRVDAATNLAAFVLNGEVVAKATLDYSLDDGWHMSVESVLPVIVSGDRVSAVHVQTD